MHEERFINTDLGPVSPEWNLAYLMVSLAPENCAKDSPDCKWGEYMANYMAEVRKDWLY